MVLVEIQFSQLGDLYAQLDDALCRYFNRRSSMRVKPEIDSAVRVKLVFGPHRLRGVAQDISRTGLGVEFDLLADSPMKRRRAEFLRYVEKRWEEIEAWQLRLTS